MSEIQEQPMAQEKDTTLAVRDRAEALAANPQLAAQTSAIEVMKQRAMILVASSFLPDAVDTWQKAAAIMMRAETLEIDYWTGLMHLNAIKGVPQPDGQLCMALIERSELMENYAVLETTDQICRLLMKRVGRPAFEITCTMEEYSKVAGSDAKRQPKTHLFWYTYKQGARRLFSDVLNNMHPKNAAQFSRIIVEDDLQTDFPEDDVFVIEEGEDKPAANAPLSPALSAANDLQNNALKADVSVSPVLDMQLIQQRALDEQIVENEFHFGALLKLMLTDCIIQEGATEAQILDAMRQHKASKQEKDDPLETVGSLNMESLYRRSKLSTRDEFNQALREMRKSRKISDTMTADQVLAALQQHLAALEFTAGEAGSVEA